MTQDAQNSLLDQLTLDEQVSLLAGATYWRTTEIPRVGLPAIKVTDGTNGARGEAFTNGSRTAAYPAEVALAATWNTDLVHEIGIDLAAEVKAKKAHIILAPAVNMHRNPLNGRNFENFSEDPHLAARMAVAFIQGVQSQGVGATIKHFIGNECETERRSINSAIDEKTLRETYLPPFEAAVREAKVTCVMTSYNWLNGTHTSENPWLLQTILRDEWGFDGIVMSDWLGTHSTEAAISAGLDLEMPGPGRFRGEKLAAAAREGRVDPADIRTSAGRIIAMGQRLGTSLDDDLSAETAQDRPATRALIRRTIAESTVLLTNKNNILPLDPTKLRRIALIGPNATVAVIHGGGSAQINAHYAITPLAGLQAALPDVQIDTALGRAAERFVPAVIGDVTLELFNGEDRSGTPTLIQQAASTDFAWFGAVAPEIDHSAFAARVSVRFTATQSGAHEIGLMSAGLSKLYLDDAEILDAWDTWAKGESYFGHGCDERRGTVMLTAGQTYELRAEYFCGDGIATSLKAIRFGLRATSALGDPAVAVALAQDADVAIIVTGLSPEWETESEDRRTLALPPGQDDLIRAVAAANPRTIVVTQAGCPLSMPWADDVAAVLHQWYPGQECGNALADVILGLQEPSGRLPQVFPASDDQITTVTERPERSGTVTYSEGPTIGQRRFDVLGLTPLFPFGHGLGFGDVSYSQPRVATTPDGGLLVGLHLHNAAPRPTSEVAQIYRVLPDGAHKLLAFAKIALNSHESRDIALTVTPTALREWDTAAAAWAMPAGPITLAIGQSSSDIRLKITTTPNL
ncbi:beta-glucosidase (plasmid) [Ketogulonicigenium robustum]|uniref:Beta-glucosidase n=1 Tax=Ketogulonicigenium robustum TaxID=92947 RepID=A0A1W6P2W5_9RHOB|nr:glycoside hydrolase family 3 C-terminal domain-containing protein [Ketogulonicigenium robustum]ARO15826.1 beta-glucosidase [Ketogulonicigenium robustum]